MRKAEQIRRFYEFGPFRVDASERVLLREGQPVTLAPKLFDTLLALVERSGHIVEKTELMETVWPGIFVEESNLSSNVSLLRKTLGATEDGKPYIETVARRGYRFVPTVEVIDETTDLIVARHTRMHVVTREEEETSDRDIVVEREAVQPLHTDRQVRSLSTRKGNKNVLILGLSAFVILSLAVLLGLRYLRTSQSPKPVGPFAQVRMVRVTTSGIADLAAISPDGKYIVHSIRGTGRQSLFLRHIATGSDQEILSREGRFLTLTFSLDGNYIYFVSSDSVLYQVPVLGGPERKLLSDVDTNITFSPDGKKLAFMRGAPSRGERSLIVANADGTGEQTVAVHRLEDRFLVDPAWSPNGATIVFALRGSGAEAPYGNLFEVSLKDRSERQITSERWFGIRGISWLRDGSGLVAIAAENQTGSTGQIWHVSYPDGKVRRISNDVNDYQSVSVTADSSTLVTVQFSQVSDIWISPSNDASRATKITTSRGDGADGISWTPDGKIVFGSRANGNPDIWIMNHDGTGKRQLTFDPGWDTRPTVSPDGSHIVFVSLRNGTRNIWRIDIDGSNEKQLTRARLAGVGQCTPDGKWVVYTNNDTQPPTLWKIPLDGGEPVQLTTSFSQLIAISQNGQIAYVYVDDSLKLRRVAIIPLEGGTPTKVFDFAAPFGQAVTWAVDGKALTYVGSPDFWTIWSQPLDGDPPRQITDFKSDRIFTYAWSRNGEELAVARGERTSDVVLIKDQP